MEQKRHHFLAATVSADLCVANSTVWRILDRFELTGCVTPNAATSWDHALHQHDDMPLIQMVCENPSVHLHKVQGKLHKVTGTGASIATICRSLKRSGFSRRKYSLLHFRDQTGYEQNIKLKFRCTRAACWFSWVRQDVSEKMQ